MVEAGWAGPWRTLCKVSPRFIHLVVSVQCSNGAQLWQDPPMLSSHKTLNPLISPLMPREDLHSPASRNICPSQSVMPLGGNHGPQPAPEKNEVRVKDSHSCTSQISESSGGSFLSCRRSANTCSEWTLLSVRRLTSFISIRGNISRS